MTDPFAARKARFEQLRGWAELAAVGNEQARAVLAQPEVADELRAHEQRIAAFLRPAEPEHAAKAVSIDTTLLERRMRSLEGTLRRHERTEEARRPSQNRCAQCRMSIGPATAWLAARGCIYRGSGACPVLAEAGW
jgi:hypothetical protein